MRYCLIIVLLSIVGCAGRLAEPIRQQSRQSYTVPNSVTMRLMARYAMATNQWSIAKSLLDKALQTATTYNPADVKMCKSDLAYWEVNNKLPMTFFHRQTPYTPQAGGGFDMIPLSLHTFNFYDCGQERSEI